MNFDLTEEQLMLRDSVRAFAKQELLPVAAKLDHDGEFPAEQVARMSEMGLMGIAIPEEWGGAGMDHVCYALAMEEISAGCASCGVIISVNNSLVGDPLNRFGTDEQKEKWLKPIARGDMIGCFCLSEPGTGSDAAAQSTVAVKDGDDWVITGAKNWITNGAQAHMAIVFAMTDKSKGTRGITAFIVPTDAEGFVVAKNEEKLGIKASSTSQISLDEVRVPSSNMLGKEGEGFKVAMSTLDGGRIGIAAQALGIARQAFDEARAYSLEREAFGGPIANLQAIQFKLADMGTEIEASRLMVMYAAWLKDQKKSFGQAASMAKVFASEMSTKVTDEAIQIYGGFGYSKEYPAERHYRDARITRIYEGTSEIQRVVIARGLLKAIQ
ncbi:MAG: acyl-CoA dehydrogenase [Myxococcota bacterium]|nr:acyl-CoA dehydrogenase [Myxococcota bacterium]